MEAKILATQKLDHRSWYLCEANLYDYVNEIHEDFYTFAIQRKIVKNIYLDKLFETIKSGDPIPVITFVSDDELNLAVGSSSFHMDMKKVEILDGLQRTFRLWAYLKLSQHYRDFITPKDFASEIKTKYSVLFETGVVSTRLIRQLIESQDIIKIEKFYKAFKLYFIVWTKLSDKQVIDKMLSLNAGQKSVTKVHQYELLFLHHYNKMSINDYGVKLIREKDKNYQSIKNGEREIGDFPFSSVMVALNSLIEQKPIRISINAIFVNPEMEEFPSDSLIHNFFSTRFLTTFIKSMRTFDEIIFSGDQSNGKKWFVKDTTLSGFFAAVGKHMKISDDMSLEVLIKEFDLCTNKLVKSIITNGLDLKEFDTRYSDVSGKSMNIGNFIRKVIFNYIDQLIVNKEASWESSFEIGGVGGDNDQ